MGFIFPQISLILQLIHFSPLLPHHKKKMKRTRKPPPTLNEYILYNDADEITDEERPIKKKKDIIDSSQPVKLSKRAKKNMKKKSKKEIELDKVS